MGRIRAVAVKFRLILSVKTCDNENKEVNIIDPNPNNNYETKKNFTGFYTEVNPKFIIPCATMTALRQLLFAPNV